MQHMQVFDSSTQGAYVIFSKHNNSPICWQSKKFQRVTKSTVAFETMALNKNIIKKIIQTYIWVFICRRSCRNCLYNRQQIFHDTLKTTNASKYLRLRVDIASLRQLVNFAFCSGFNQRKMV